MDTITFALLSVIGICLALYLRSRKPKKRLPPNLPGLPIIGNFFNSIPKSCAQFTEVLSLGHLYRYKLGLFDLVMLNSFDAIHEALVGQAEVFSGRQHGVLIEKFTRNAGVVSIDGPVWQEQRRFLLRLMREFGLGRPVMADLIAEECEAMKESLESTLGQPINTQLEFSSATNNVIARLIFGERSGTNDKKFKDFEKHLSETLKFSFISVIGVTFPWIFKVPILRDVYRYFCDLLHHGDWIYDYIREKINHQAALLASMDPPPTEVSQATNICEAFLIEQANQERVAPGAHSFTECQLIRNMNDLFSAGTETSATTLSWTMLLLSVNPDVQARVQGEIEAKIGRQRAPKMTDRQELPYVCAVMDEVLRYSSLAPFNLIHRVTRDTVLMGYDLPANTLVQCNLYGVHHDPRLWSNPNEFFPGHFLTADGEYRPSKYLLPFSLGKRACLGESLARMEYFLAFVTLMQAFEVRLAPSNTDTKAILEGGIGLVRHPLPHHIIFKRLENEAR